MDQKKHPAMPPPDVQIKMMEFFIERSVPKILSEQQKAKKEALQQ